jgi:ribonuclease P protein component
MRSAEFARALAAPAKFRSRHFALHYVPSEPIGWQLSTGDAPNLDAPVDDSPRSIAVLVPKRHARRAVTRSLLKRQARAAFRGRAGALAPGLWLLRLRAPFDSREYPSAASSRLREAARGELERLLASVAAAGVGGAA